MSERSKPEWRGWIKNGVPVLAIGYINLTNQINKDLIAKTLDSIPEDRVWLSFSASRPDKEYREIMVGLLGKTFTILPIKIFGKTFPKPPEVNIKVEVKQKKA